MPYTNTDTQNHLQELSSFLLLFWLPSTNQVSKLLVSPYIGVHLSHNDDMPLPHSKILWYRFEVICRRNIFYSSLLDYAAN